MTDLNDYHRLIGVLRGSGLTEAQAHATAEQVMEDAIRQAQPLHCEVRKEQRACEQ